MSIWLDRLSSGKSHSEIFVKIVIGTLFLFIVARDVIMFLLVDQDSDGNKLPFWYYTFFLTFQLWWCYSSWAMLFTLFYIIPEEVPNRPRYWQNNDEYPLKIFLEFLTKLFMWGKFDSIIWSLDYFKEQCDRIQGYGRDEVTDWQK